MLKKASDPKVGTGFGINPMLKKASGPKVGAGFGMNPMLKLALDQAQSRIGLRTMRCVGTEHGAALESARALFRF